MATFHTVRRASTTSRSFLCTFGPPEVAPYDGQLGGSGPTADGDALPQVYIYGSQVAALLLSLAHSETSREVVLAQAPSPRRDTPSSEYTRFEKARILGARALQVSLGAPILVEVPTSLVDPVAIAELEYEAAMIPITVRRGSGTVD